MFRYVLGSRCLVWGYSNQLADYHLFDLKSLLTLWWGVHCSCLVQCTLYIVHCTRQLHTPICICICIPWVSLRVRYLHWLWGLLWHWDAGVGEPHVDRKGFVAFRLPGQWGCSDGHRGNNFKVLPTSIGCGHLIEYLAILSVISSTFAFKLRPELTI